MSPHGKVQGRIPAFQGETQLNDGMIFVPESERPLDACVLGVDPGRDDYFLLPKLRKTASLTEKHFREIQEQLYWLDFELAHGKVMRVLPPAAQVYTALPDPRKVKKADGRERAMFLHYLKARCGWSDQRAAAQIHFFKSPVPLVWAQDIGKILGCEASGQWVIFRGPDDLPEYRQAVADLCAAYPKVYTYRELPKGVSAEGGDENLARSPDGRLVFMVGRHRVYKYLEATNGEPAEGRVLTQEETVQAQAAFSEAFAQIPVVFLPTGALENPALGNSELFHLDMSVATMADGTKARAFVPTYVAHPMDRLAGQPLDPSFVEGLQREYDLTAGELESLGYQVQRLWVDDHPVRSPANLVRYYDPGTRRCTVWLAKYPSQEPGPDGLSAQQKLLNALSELGRKAGDWEARPTDQTYGDLRAQIAAVWKEMDEATAAPDDAFNQNRARLIKDGFNVMTVGDYAWGSGGLHCQLLH